MIHWVRNYEGLASGLIELNVGDTTLDQLIDARYTLANGTSPRKVKTLEAALSLRQNNQSLIVIPAMTWLSLETMLEVERQLPLMSAPFRLIGTQRKETLALCFPPSNVALDPHRIEKSIEISEWDSESPSLLVKNRIDLSRIEREMHFEKACRLILAGVKIRDPRNIFITGELVCGSRVEIDSGVTFEGRVVLGDDVRVGAYSILIRSQIHSNTRIHPFSMVEDAVIGSQTFIGPYGRVRPGSVIGDSVQIGNFVEIKKSRIGNGSRINHLAFIGNATLEKNVTIGAGCITCNHDGKGAVETLIGEGAYIGSGCELVAPLTVGPNATIGAGSTITRNVPAEKLTIARAPQSVIEHWRRK